MMKLLSRILHRSGDDKTTNAANEALRVLFDSNNDLLEESCNECYRIIRSNQTNQHADAVRLQKSLLQSLDSFKSLPTIKGCYF